MEVIWQDVLLMVGGFGFSVALIPTLRGKNKPHKLTSLFTFLILCTFSIAYGSLGLWLALGSTILTASIWMVFFIQARKKELKNGDKR